jgi:YVTN family beta-propeller protein
LGLLRGGHTTLHAARRRGKGRDVKSRLASTLTIAALALVSPASALAPGLEVEEVADTASMPKGAILSPDAKRFYVTNFGMANGHNITVYDAASLALVDTINLPGIVVESVLSSDGKTLFASNFSRDSVQVVDVATHKVRRELQAGLHPKILVLSKDDKTLFAANWSGASVTVVDTETGKTIRTLSVGLHPRGMALTRAGVLYVANFDGASIDVFYGDGFSRTYRLAVCRIPRHLALSPDEKTLYISCYHDSEIAALDLETEAVTHRVQVGTNPKSIEVTRDGRYVYSADYGEEAHGVSVVDTTDWKARIFTVPGMDRGSGIAVTPDGEHALVTGWYDNHVYLVGFEGRGGHPEDARKKIEGWVRHRHYHPPLESSEGSP